MSGGGGRDRVKTHARGHIIVAPRSKVAPFDTFVNRYQPSKGKDGRIMRDHADPVFHDAIFSGGTAVRHVWTIVDGSNGRLYIVPGFKRVNVMGRVWAARPWGSIENQNPGYTYAEDSEPAALPVGSYPVDAYQPGSAR